MVHETDLVHDDVFRGTDSKLSIGKKYGTS